MIGSTFIESGLALEQAGLEPLLSCGLCMGIPQHILHCIILYLAILLPFCTMKLKNLNVELKFYGCRYIMRKKLESW